MVCIKIQFLGVDGIKLFKSQLSNGTEAAAKCCNQTASLTCQAAKLCPSGNKNMFYQLFFLILTKLILEEQKI